MNLSKKLLLALAGASISAPLAAPAQEVASLTGSAAINEYMQQQDVDRFRAWESKNQVTSVNQFSDVLPTDWAYQALSNLVEKYGCVAGYPNGKFKGGNAMTRYEAAALLNACLDRISEVTDELQKLLNEFDSELTVLTSRVDGLESKVGQLQAQQFSTTTKLKGETSFIIAGSPDYVSKKATPNDATTFNYDLRLSFDTSFTGKDLLRTRLRSGNFTDDPFGSSSNVFKLDKAETGKEQCGTAGAGCVWIDRLFYTFPVGDTVKITAGAQVRNTEIISFIPTAYKSDILDFFNLAGATGTYNKATGAGAGLTWKQKVPKGKSYATFDVNWISQSGFQDSDVGAFNNISGQNIFAQLGYRGPNWGAAVAYRYGSGNSAFRDPNTDKNGVGKKGVNALGDSNSVSVAGFWQPLEAGWMPSVSLGFSYTNVDGANGTAADNLVDGDYYSWMAGLQWSDVFMEGNSAGFAIGSPQYTTDSKTKNFSGAGIMYEIFYKYQVSNNISITPSIFWIDSNYNDDNNGDSTWGGVIQTTFRF